MAYREDVDYQELINQAVSAGDYRAAAQYEQSRNEKIGALNAAGGGTNKYGAEATSNYSQYLMPENYSGSSTGVGVHTNDQQSIKDQMNANSISWWNADDATRAQLAAQNQQLGSALGGSVAFDSQTGYWSGDAAAPNSSNKPSFDYSVYQDNKPTYESDYSARIDEMLNQILNRDSFSYNAQEDPLYQQYASTYNREGQRAMNDTLAAAASSAGGMNSYALSTAQQAQNYYGAQLGDKIPELYELAYQMYLDDIDNQVRDLGLLQGMDDTQYGRYRDTMSDWRDDRDFSYGMYRDDMGDWQWETSFDYNAGRDTIGDSRYESETAYDRALSFLNAGVMPDSSVLAQAGISSEEAERILAAQQLESAGSTSGGGGNTTSNAVSGYSAPEGWDDAKIRQFQRDNRLVDDGIWGPKTQAAYEAQYGSEPDDNPVLDILGGGNDTGNGNEELEVDMESVSALGYGPISADRLAELEKSGKIESYEEDGKIKFRKAPEPVIWMGNIFG